MTVILPPPRDPLLRSSVDLHNAGKPRVLYTRLANDSATAKQGGASGTITHGTSAVSGAPNSAHYLTSQAESELSAEVNLGALTTGLLFGTVSGGVSTISSKAIGTDVQAYDSDLAALAANSTNGLWARTGSGTGAARTLTAGDGINILNGDGASGAPTISTAGNLILSYQAVTTAGTTTLTTSGGFVLVTLSGSISATIALPAASGNDGQVYFIRRTDTDFMSTCTVDPNGTDAWEGTGSGTYSLGVAGMIIIACDGAGWWILSQS